MAMIRQFLQVVDVYLDAAGTYDSVLSSRMFNDGKRLGALRRGADITTTRLENAFVWLSRNWPPRAVWPESVPRPDPIDWKKQLQRA